MAVVRDERPDMRKVAIMKRLIEDRPSDSRMDIRHKDNSNVTLGLGHPSLRAVKRREFLRGDLIRQASHFLAETAHKRHFPPLFAAAHAGTPSRSRAFPNGSNPSLVRPSRGRGRTVSPVRP